MVCGVLTLIRKVVHDFVEGLSRESRSDPGGFAAMFRRNQFVGRRLPGLSHSARRQHLIGRRRARVFLYACQSMRNSRSW